MDTSRRTYIIAEAGVNHNGSLDMALRLVDAAADAGADAVKFQTFKADSLVTPHAAKADYQIQNTKSVESQHEMLKKLELHQEQYAELIRYCAQKKIDFISTPFDLESAELLINTFELDIIKISSGDVTNAPLLLKIAQAGKRVILSTGMSTLGDVEMALGVLAYGYINSQRPNGEEDFKAAYSSAEGQRCLSRYVCLLHCTTEYPAPLNEVNLSAMDTLRAAFGLEVGFSDHTEGIVIPVAAVARGATVVEKHITLDRALPGPDHVASLEPDELVAMIKYIRETEVALGGKLKMVTPSERKNISVARKSVVAAGPIAQGEAYTIDNLTTKRPGHGISPTRFWDLLGKPADKNYEKDDLIGL